MNDLLDSRAYRAALLGAFLALSLAPLLGGFLGVGNDVARIELRAPAQWPGLPTDRRGWQELPGAIDDYLDDAFGFRSQLVTANSLLHLALGVSGSQRYVVGKDGWFFHKEVDDILAQARGVDSFEMKELRDWIKEMEERRRWLARRGIDFLIVIAPSKHTIYPEFLPPWFNVVGPTRYEQLRAVLPNTNLDVLDLHAPLLAAKSSGHPLYFKTDGHWNDLGAFIAYREIARWIQGRHPGVGALELSDFHVRWEEASVGTITRGLNIREFETEHIPKLELQRPSRIVSEEELGTGQRFAATYVSRTRTTLDNGVKVLFIRDSFATPIAEYIAETVSETMTMHHRQGRFDRAFIKEYAPDVVVYEMIERGLRWRLR